MKISNLLVLASLLLMCSCYNFPSDFEVTDGLLRSELVKKSLPEQRQIFSNLDPEMKTRLYRYKLKCDLRDRRLSKNERRILKEIYDYILPEAYIGEPTSPEVEAELLIKLDALGWDDVSIFKYTMTFMTASEFENQFQ